MTREWVIDAYEGFESMRLQDCARQEPGPTDIRLRIETFALNWGDEDLMHDHYSFSFSELPARIGSEAAGIVEAVGAQVKDIKIGERYCTLPYFYDLRGTSADTVLVDQAYVAKAPDGLTAVEAASIWMQFLTAYYPVVELAKAAPGRNILVPAGTSTAGNAALQIGRMLGATMIATTRSEANRQILLDSGADHVFVDNGDNLAEFLNDVTDGVGVHASFDPVGGDFMNRYASSMAMGGRLFLYGALNGTFSPPPYVDMFQKNLLLQAYSVFNYVEDPEACERGKNFVYNAISNGELRPHVDRTFTMESHKEAWRYLKSARTDYGKVVVETGANGED